MSKEQWQESVYCFSCGTRLVKGIDPVDRVTIPSRSARTLRVVTGTIMNRPVLGSVGSIGIGAAGIAVAPLLMVAGQWLVGIGVGTMLLSWAVDSVLDEAPCRGGVKLGLGIAASGIIVQGSGYVLLAAGVVTATAGVGLGTYTGVRAYLDYRQMKRVLAAQPLLLTEGGKL
jgi:hypothetical protein